jgi:hypothetical protein
VTKVRFELPGKITKSKQPGAGPAGQRYESRVITGHVNGHIGCSVSVETSVSGALYLIQLPKFTAVVASQFRQGGAKDLVTSKPRLATVQHHPSVTFTFSFTAATGAKVTFLEEVIDTSNSQIILQTLATDAAVVSQSELHQLDGRLRRSLRLS